MCDRPVCKRVVCLHLEPSIRVKIHGCWPADHLRQVAQRLALPTHQSLLRNWCHIHYRSWCFSLGFGSTNILSGRRGQYTRIMRYVFGGFIGPIGDCACPRNPIGRRTTQKAKNEQDTKHQQRQAAETSCPPGGTPSSYQN